MTTSLGFARTQSGMNGKAYVRYKKADETLNQTYQVILNEYRYDAQHTVADDQATKAARS